MSPRSNSISSASPPNRGSNCSCNSSAMNDASGIRVSVHNALAACSTLLYVACSWSPINSGGTPYTMATSRKPHCIRPRNSASFGVRVRLWNDTGWVMTATRCALSAPRNRRSSICASDSACSRDNAWVLSAGPSTPAICMPPSKIARLERMAPYDVSMASRADAIGDRPLYSSCGLSYFSQITSDASNAMVRPPSS